MSTEDLPRYDEDITEDYSFDELAKGMASGAISRGRALKLVGASLLGFGSLGLFGGVAGAKRRRPGSNRPPFKKKHHQRRGGTPPNPFICSFPAVCHGTFFNCLNNPECFCYQTTEGTGVCLDQRGPCGSPCTSSSQCPANNVCVLDCCNAPMGDCNPISNFCGVFRP